MVMTTSAQQMTDRSEMTRLGMGVTMTPFHFRIMRTLHLVPAGPEPHPTLTQLLSAVSKDVLHATYSSSGDVKLPSSDPPLAVILVQCVQTVSVDQRTPAHGELPSPANPAFLHMLSALTSAHPQAFVCVCSVDDTHSADASSAASSSDVSSSSHVRGSGTEDARFRWACFEQRVSMVTALVAARRDLATALAQVASIDSARKHASKGTPTFTCYICAQAGLPEDALHTHVPLYHANVPQSHHLPCPVCSRLSSRLGVHLFNDHGPPGRGEAPSESRTSPNVIYPYALVVCRRPRDGRYLLVQEFASSGFWLPGGRAENGESLQEAAVRETREEAGVEVELKGILRVEYTSREGDERHAGVTRLRIIFYAEPAADSGSSSSSSTAGDACKTLPDYESVGASWIDLSELPHLHLRGSEPRKWFSYVATGGAIHPLSLLKAES